MYNSNSTCNQNDIILECMCDCIKRLISDYGTGIFSDARRAGALIGDYLTDSRVANKKNLLRRSVSSGALAFIAQAGINDEQYLHGRKSAITLLIEEEFMAPEVAETVLVWFDRALGRTVVAVKKASPPPPPPTPPTPPTPSPWELEAAEKSRLISSIASYCRLIGEKVNEATNMTDDRALKNECEDIFIRMASIQGLDKNFLTVGQLKAYEAELITAYNRLGEIIEIARQPRVRELPFITTVFWGAPMTYVRGVPFTLMDPMHGPVGYYTVACLEYNGMQYIVAKQPPYQNLLFAFKLINNMLYLETDASIFPKLSGFCYDHGLN